MSSWWDPYPLTATANYLGLKRAGTRAAAADPGAVDAWRPQRHLLRRRRVRAGCGARLLGRRLARVPAAVLRSCGEGRAAGRAAGAHLRHGRRQRAAQRGRQAGAWRALDRRAGLAAARTPSSSAFHLHGDGTARSRGAGGGCRAAVVRFRSVASGADDRRRDEQPRAGGVLRAPGTRSRHRTSSAARRPTCRWRRGADVLVFQTAAAGGDRCRWSGRSRRELFVATDGPDTDFTAKLIDVHPPSADYPQGYAMILTDGIMRLRYAEDPAHPRLRQPGEVVRIRITLFPTANLFLPGHRIRLDVSSSEFPEIRRQPEHRRAGGRGAAQADRGEHGVRRCGAARAGWCCRCCRSEAAPVTCGMRPRWLPAEQPAPERRGGALAVGDVRRVGGGRHGTADQVPADVARRRSGPLELHDRRRGRLLGARRPRARRPRRSPRRMPRPGAARPAGAARSRYPRCRPTARATCSRRCCASVIAAASSAAQAACSSASAWFAVSPEPAQISAQRRNGSVSSSAVVVSAL